MARPPAAAPVRPTTARSLRRRGLAAAAATAVIAGPVLFAPPASAASSTPGLSGGRTSSTVVDLSIAGQAELALFQAQSFSQARRTGSLSRTINPQQATAFAGAVGGTPGEQTPAQLQAFNGAFASLDKPGPVTNSGQSFPDNPLLDFSGGKFRAAVVRKTGSSTSSGDVVSLEIGPLGDIAGLDAVTGPFQTALGTVLDALVPEVGMSTQQILDALNPLTGQIPSDSPLAAAVAGLSNGEKKVLAQLQQLDQILFDTPLLSIDDITQSQSIEQQVGGVLSKSATSVGKIQVLGGLVSLTGPRTSAQALATGRPGTAKALARPRAPPTSACSRETYSTSSSEGTGRWT